VRLILLFVFFFAGSTLFGQGYNRKNKDAFPQTPRFEKTGWYFGLGANYPLNLATIKEAEGTKIGDTTFATNSNPIGQLGAYAEFGRYHMIENLYFFRYWNYGINYRWIHGKEGFENQITTPTGNVPLLAGKNTFSDHFLNAHIEISGVNKLSDKTFLQHTIGGQAGYAILSKRSYSTNLPGLEQKTQNRLHSYVYYRLGWGARVSKKLIMIPSIEVPLLNAYTFNSGRYDMPYFNSHYWPITFSIRFFLCRPYRLKSCPPVDALGLPDGFDKDEPGK
jgi:hypothetical protein